MGSTDSLDSGQYSVADEQLPPHREGLPPPASVAAASAAPRRASADGRRKRGTSGVSPPVPAVREHHNRSKSADGDAFSGDCARKTHAKSLSVGDGSFDHKIRLWRKRADSQGSIDRPKPLPAARHHHHRTHHHRGAPDLVMDLPVRPDGGCAAVASTSATAAAAAEPAVQQESASNAGAQEPDSPDMGTAAERFAKQNQCTLKKYSKPAAPPSPRAGGKPELPPKSTKPPLKAKPQLFKKPVFLAPAVAAAVTADDAAATSQP